MFRNAKWKRLRNGVRDCVLLSKPRCFATVTMVPLLWARKVFLPVSWKAVQQTSLFGRHTSAHVVCDNQHGGRKRASLWATERGATDQHRLPVLSRSSLWTLRLAMVEWKSNHACVRGEGLGRRVAHQKMPTNEKTTKPHLAHRPAPRSVRVYVGLRQYADVVVSISMRPWRPHCM